MFLHTYTFTINIVSLVSEVHYFAGVIPEYKRIIVKCAIKQSAKQGNEKKAHPHIKYGPSTNVARTQAQLGAHLHQAVARQASRWCGHITPSPAQPQLAMAVAWRHAELAQGSFLFYHAPNRPVASINTWVVLSCHTHHTRAILPLHLYSFYYFQCQDLGKACNWRSRTS